jgi:hypothetical protein
MYLFLLLLYRKKYPWEDLIAKEQEGDLSTAKLPFRSDRAHIETSALQFEEQFSWSCWLFIFNAFRFFASHAYR